MNRRRAIATILSGTGVTVGGFTLYRDVVSRGRTPETDHQKGDGPASSESEPDPVPETRTGDFLHGVTPKSIGEDGLALFSEWTGVPPATVNVFADLGWPEEKIKELFEHQLSFIWERGHVPILILQPFFGLENHPDSGEDFDLDDRPDPDDYVNEETSEMIAREITAGEYDDVLENWADALKGWLRPSDDDVPDRRLYLNFAPEMNGDWVPWSGATGDSTPADFVDMWRRVHDIVTSKAIDKHHLQWMWAPDNDGTPSAGYSASEYYPGDSYVDWTGVHGYNWYEWGGWVEPEERYDHVLEDIRSVTDKPLALTEYGTSSAYGDEHRPELKAEWIEKIFEYIVNEDIRMACWFNVDKETDWAVLGGERGTGTWDYDGTTYDVYPEYRTEIRERDALSAHPDHPRRLTDEEFTGEFAATEAEAEIESDD